MEKIFCKYCGAKIEEDSIFCFSCGSKIKHGNSSRQEKTISTKRDSDERYIKNSTKVSNQIDTTKKPLFKFMSNVVSPIFTFLLVLAPVFYGVYIMDVNEKLMKLKEDEKDLPRLESRSKTWSLEDMYPSELHPRDYDFIQKYIGSTFDPTGHLYERVEASVEQEKTSYGIIVVLIIICGIAIKVIVYQTKKSNQGKNGL